MTWGVLREWGLKRKCIVKLAPGKPLKFVYELHMKGVSYIFCMRLSYTVQPVVVHECAMRNIFLLLLLLLFSAAALPAQAATFVFSAENEPLPDLLCSFATRQNRGCHVSSAISGVVSGDFDFATEDAFFAFMERSNNIVSHKDASTIYFYDKSEMETVTISLRNVSVNEITRALKDMQSFDARFPLRPLSGGRMVRLDGPPVYVELVASLAADLEANFSAQKATRVFKLTHAWADDVKFYFREDEITIPGVATLLRNITAGGISSVGAVQNSGARPTRISGTGLARNSNSQRNQRERAQSQPAANAGERAGSGAARILADSRLNAVIIWDDEELMPLYETIIKELDQSVPLVEIRTAIVDVSVTRVSELGFAWSGNTQGGDHFNFVGGMNVGTGATATDFTSTLGNGLNLTTIFRSGLDTFMSRIHAMEEDGDASVLSRPVVLTMDNIQATLEVTNTFYIEVGGYQEVDLFDVQYGTVLRVTPHVIDDEKTGKKLVKLNVHIEDGGSQAAPTGSGLSYPVVSRSTVNTQAVVGNAELLIIGGHYYESDAGGDTGVPVLKNVPLIGNLFKTNSDNFKKQERLFLISPRIINPDILRSQSEQYGQVFERTMESPRTMTRTVGGCGRRVKVDTPQPVVRTSVGNGPGTGVVR
jgi:type III secretion outer membrane pore, YscC/HrcC family